MGRCHHDAILVVQQTSQKAALNCVSPHNLLTNAHLWVERDHQLLEDHGDVATTHRSNFSLSERGKAAVAEPDRTGDDV